MYKRILILIMAILTTSLIGCANNPTESPQASQESVSSQTEGVPTNSSGSESSSISVDEGLLTTQITLPATLFEQADGFDAEAYKNEHDFKAVKVNDDGSVTITMTKNQHKQMLSEFEKTVDESINDILEGEETKDLFVSVERNSDCTKLVVKIKGSEADFMQSMALLGVDFQLLFYQAFAGTEKASVETTIMNAESGDVISVTTFPNDSESSAAS